MVSSDLSVLHQFADEIGVKRCWFQNKRGKNQPHYDVRKERFGEILRTGRVKVISRKKLLMFLKKNFS